MKRRRDKYNRIRDKTISFRVSQEEWDTIESAVTLSGLSKQEYILNRLQNREFEVFPNSRLHKALKDEINRLYAVLLDVSNDKELGIEVLNQLNKIFEVYQCLGGDKNEK